MKRKTNILVIGGLHGDEPSGVTIVKHFKKRPFTGISVLMGNSRAVKANKRFLETDLNRSFSAPTPISYEEKLASKIKNKIRGFDFVIDIHNTRADYMSCAVVVSEPNAVQIGVAKQFNFQRLVIMPPSGALIAQLPDQALSLEISNNEIDQFAVDGLIKKLSVLDLTPNNNVKISKYKYIHSVKPATCKNLNIKPLSLKNFQPLNEEQKKLLGLDITKHFCPIFKKKRLHGENAFIIVEKMLE